MNVYKQQHPSSGVDLLHADAAKRIATSVGGLQNAHRMLMSLITDGGLSLYPLGKVRQSLWELEQRLGLHRAFMSQAGQDKYIYETFFPNKKAGTFLEIGGFDGLTGSNCYFFEKTLGWSGAIVEAAPHLIPSIQFHRNVPIKHAAIGSHDGTAEFLSVASGYTQMSGLLGSYDANTLKKVRQHPQHKEQITVIDMLTLPTAMKELGIDQVDYCSIDVEGAERSILEACDIRKLNIDVLSIENHRPPRPADRSTS